MSSSFIYSIPLLSELNKQIVFEFKICHPPLNEDPKNKKSKTKMDDEYSILIISIDYSVPENKTDAIATAKTERLEYIGTVLKSIEYCGQLYLPEDGIYYWFSPPEKTRPKKFTDGSIQIQLKNTSEIEFIYAYPLNSIPFMDLTGAFRYEYMVVAWVGVTAEYKSIKMQVTLIEINDKFTAMIDNATGFWYSIERTKMFREISDINTQK